LKRRKAILPTLSQMSSPMVLDATAAAKLKFETMVNFGIRAHFTANHVAEMIADEIGADVESVIARMEAFPRSGEAECKVKAKGKGKGKGKGKEAKEGKEAKAVVRKPSQYAVANKEISASLTLHRGQDEDAQTIATNVLTDMKVSAETPKLSDETARFAEILGNGDGYKIQRTRIVSLVWGLMKKSGSSVASSVEGSGGEESGEESGEAGAAE